jgi:hypothetical protein
MCPLADGATIAARKKYNAQGIEIEPKWDYPNQDDEFEDVLTRGGGITVPLDSWQYNIIQGDGSKKGSKSPKKAGGGAKSDRKSRWLDIAAAFKFEVRRAGAAFSDFC